MIQKQLVVQKKRQIKGTYAWSVDGCIPKANLDYNPIFCRISTFLLCTVIKTSK